MRVVSGLWPVAKGCWFGETKWSFCFLRKSLNLCDFLVWSSVLITLSVRLVSSRRRKTIRAFIHQWMNLFSCDLHLPQQGNWLTITAVEEIWQAIKTCPKLRLRRRRWNAFLEKQLEKSVNGQVITCSETAFMVDVRIWYKPSSDIRYKLFAFLVWPATCFINSPCRC